MPTAHILDERELIDAFLVDPAEDSFRALFRTLSPQIFAYFCVRGADRSTAEDLTQEVMLVVFTQARQLRDRALFRPWLFRIARNAWLQSLRHQSRQLHSASFEEAADIQDHASDAFRDSCFSEWLAWLAPEDRELILLRYVEGLEYHEIASMLGLPQGTVQWKIFRIKRRLAERFGRTA